MPVFRFTVKKTVRYTGIPGKTARNTSITGGKIRMPFILVSTVKDISLEPLPTVSNVTLKHNLYSWTDQSAGLTSHAIKAKEVAWLIYVLYCIHKQYYISKLIQRTSDFLTPLSLFCSFAFTEISITQNNSHISPEFT